MRPVCSSTTVFPGIRAALRAPTDPLGTLPTEITIVNGGGSQTNGSSRWGNYSAMDVDPVGTARSGTPPVPSFPIWATAACAKPQVGDFNGDAKADIALIGVSGWASIPVAFSNGNGTFNVTNQAAGNFPAWTASTSAKTFVGDFNGDGRSDLAVIGPNGWGSLPVAFSNGNGTFNVTNAAITNFAGWAATANAKPLIADFNADGKSDIALVGVHGWGTIPVAFSNGNGTFNVTNAAAANFSAWAATANAMHLVRDFNGDGRPDIALTGPHTWGSVPVAFSNGNGTFNVINAPIVNFANWPSLTNVKALPGRYNPNTSRDIALTGASGWGSIPVALSNGNGTFNVSNPAVGAFGAWSATTGVVHLQGDFNGDGRTDIALTGATGWGSIPVAFSNFP